MVSRSSQYQHLLWAANVHSPGCCVNETKPRSGPNRPAAAVGGCELEVRQFRELDLQGLGSFGLFAMQVQAKSLICGLGSLESASPGII